MRYFCPYCKVRLRRGTMRSIISHTNGQKHRYNVQRYWSAVLSSELR
ncbi:Hypothetical protein GLP15_2267 [Giardia lamblia P15]|uniref:Matrin-type domain-containing protein n=1 Tax=Giardia intestinalis (strain P15) TaxID=658858 RepID=E1F8P9_GIAIA|nr:Hypothetical protein GLP15_2267 [Giardia lamblia P15]